MRQNTRTGGYALIMVGIGMAVLATVLMIAFTSPGTITPPSTSSSGQAPYLKTQAELEAEATSGGILAPIDDARTAVKAVENATAERTGTRAPREAYVNYTEDLLTSGTNVIFFYTPTCANCRALEQSISTNLNQIPSTVTIFKANYETEQALREQYNVSNPHTLVVVSKTGQLIKTLDNPTNTLTELLAQL